jgi:hypothetical protein
MLASSMRHLLGLVGHAARVAAVLASGLASVLASCQRLPVDYSASGDFASGSSGSGGTATATSGGGGGGGGAPIYECSPVTQDCEDGFKCTPILDGPNQTHYVCVPATGTANAGDACQPSPATGTDACNPGLVCLADETGSGVCVALCTTDSDCAAGVCLEHPEVRTPYCATYCSPIEQDCWNPLHCRPTIEAFVCHFPAEVDVGGTFDECYPATQHGCAPGLMCVTGALLPGCAHDACCSPACDAGLPDADTSCQSQTGSQAVVCQPWLPAAAPGFETFGACLMPA